MAKKLHTARRPGPAIAVLAGCLLLGGCSSYDVQIDAPALEYLGVIDGPDAGKEKIAETRAPLVVPPTASLPEPGRGAPDGEQVWPNDPDVASANAKSEDEKTQERIADGGFDEKNYNEDFERATGQKARGPGIFGDYEEKASQD